MDCRSRSPRPRSSRVAVHQQDLHSCRDVHLAVSDGAPSYARIAGEPAPSAWTRRRALAGCIVLLARCGAELVYRAEACVRVGACMRRRAARRGDSMSEAPWACPSSANRLGHGAWQGFLPELARVPRGVRPSARSDGAETAGCREGEGRWMTSSTGVNVSLMKRTPFASSRSGASATSSTCKAIGIALKSCAGMQAKSTPAISGVVSVMVA
jgi:hypothetical protein